MPSPFIVSTAELFRHRGARHQVVRSGRLPGVELSAARLTDDDVTVDVILEAQGETVTMTGTATGTWTGECRRCLETTSGEVVTELSEVFEPEPVEGETYALERDHLDLEPVVREALALALPLAPLCDEACGGPDPGGHPVGVEDEADAAAEDADAEPSADPRWAALDQLRFDR
jgi:uncharacterized protein